MISGSRSLLAHLWLREATVAHTHTHTQKCSCWAMRKGEFDKSARRRTGEWGSSLSGCLYRPLRPAFADDTYIASADDTTLLTSFTPPSHSYKLFLTPHKIPYVNWNACWMLTKQKNSGCLQTHKQARKGRKATRGITLAELSLFIRHVSAPRREV